MAVKRICLCYSLSGGSRELWWAGGTSWRSLSRSLTSVGPIWNAFVNGRSETQGKSCPIVTNGRDLDDAFSFKEASPPLSILAREHLASLCSA